MSYLPARSEPSTRWLAGDEQMEGDEVGQLKKVLNFHEAGADLMLQEYAAEWGYRVQLKMRLCDAIDAEGDVRNRRERNFLRTSHLDFVLVAEDSLQPVLAVEYDGSQHLTDPVQVARDRIKDRLCAAAGLPLLRIDSGYMRKSGKWQVLRYILWAHEMGKAFFAAQERGDIPIDEPFFHGAVLDRGPDDRWGSSGLDIPANTFLIGFRIRVCVLWEAQWWRSTGPTIEVRNLMALENGHYLAAHCVTRDFAIPGISALEIARELAMAELGKLAEEYEAGSAVALSQEEGKRIRADIGETQGFGPTANGWHITYRGGDGPW